MSTISPKVIEAAKQALRDLRAVMQSETDHGCCCLGPSGYCHCEQARDERIVRAVLDAAAKAETNTAAT